MARSRNSRNDKHHPVPSSLGGVEVVWVNKRKHAIYHQLFSNRHPMDIIEYLVNYWWGGNWAFVEQALERRNAREP